MEHDAARLATKAGVMMGWPKKKPGGAKPTTAFEVQRVERGVVNMLLTNKAADGWFINGVTADGPHHVLVVSCKKTWPKKKAASDEPA